jgi:hypothetical protein
VAGAIFGDWTHRRTDAGGSRSLGGDLARAKPFPAWSWDAPRGSRIDQVRTSGGVVLVATMEEEGSFAALGFSHATLYALDGESGRIVAHRLLPDPCPVAALVVEGRTVHAVATKGGEPVFWYALEAPDLVPTRRAVVPALEAARSDVLDAWARPDGGLWLELDPGDGSSVFVSVPHPGILGDTPKPPAPPSPARFALGPRRAVRSPRDACEVGRALVVPADAPGEGMVGPRTALFKLEPERGEGQPERRAGPRRIDWARSDTSGVKCTAHAIAAGGLVHLVLSGDRGDELFAVAAALDRATGVERWRTPPAAFSSASAGRDARLAYVGGEIAVQQLAPDGAPCSDLLLAGERGAMVPVLLGVHRSFVLDLAVGDTLLAHAMKKDGHILLAGFALDKGGRRLGRRAKMSFSIESPSMGEDPRVYAGAGKILVKGEKRLVAFGV